MKFIEEVSHPFYALRDKRGFFDKELPLDDDMLDVLVAIDVQAQKAQLFLRTVYNGGDRPVIEVPLWLENAVGDLKRARQGSAPASNKTLRLNSKPTA
jgi:hypothetical protein